MSLKYVVVVVFVVAIILEGIRVLDASAVLGVQFINVGGQGWYNQVTQMIPNNGVWNVCPASQSADPSICYKTSVYKSSSLAPFDEDLTLALRGPMAVKNIAVYVPDVYQWNRTTYWDTSNTNTQNLVWMDNAGEWSICHGSGQSYMSSTGVGSADKPQNFDGVLDNDVNVNVMSSVNCTPSLCSGFSRGIAKVGWKGNDCGEKMFVISAQMPHNTTGAANNNDMPAIWLLNGNVVRTNQWGCNCRGMGEAGGCGELDVAEVLSSNYDDHCTSTLYSFKQSIGSSSYLARPTLTPTTYVVVFDASGSGTVTILDKPDFPITTTAFSRATVRSWIIQTAPTLVYLNKPYSGPSCPTPVQATEDSGTAQGKGVSTPLAVGIGVICVFVVLVAVVVGVVIIKRRKRELM